MLTASNSSTPMGIIHSKPSTFYNNNAHRCTQIIKANGDCVLEVKVLKSLFGQRDVHRDLCTSARKRNKIMCMKLMSARAKCLCQRRTGFWYANEAYIFDQLRRAALFSKDDAWQYNLIAVIDINTSSGCSISYESMKQRHKKHKVKRMHMLIRTELIKTRKSSKLFRN